MPKLTVFFMNGGRCRSSERRYSVQENSMDSQAPATKVHQLSCLYEICTVLMVKQKTEKIRNNGSVFKRDLDHLVDEPADGKCCSV